MKTCLLLLLSGLFFPMELFASAEEATSKAREIVLDFKVRGFTNIRTEMKGRLEKNGKKHFKATLLEGEEYLAIVSGDTLVKEIGLYLFDAKGNKIEVVYEKSGTRSVFKYKPKATGQHIFFIKLKSGSGYFQFYLATRQPGWIK